MMMTVGKQLVVKFVNFFCGTNSDEKNFNR